MTGGTNRSSTSSTPARTARTVSVLRLLDAGRMGAGGMVAPAAAERSPAAGAAPTVSVCPVTGSTYVELDVLPPATTGTATFDEPPPGAGVPDVGVEPGCGSVPGAVPAVDAPPVGVVPAVGPVEPPPPWWWPPPW